MINKQVEKCDEDLNHIVTDALIDKAHDRGCLRPEKLESNAERVFLQRSSQKHFKLLSYVKDIAAKAIIFKRSRACFADLIA